MLGTVALSKTNINYIQLCIKGLDALKPAPRT